MVLRGATRNTAIEFVCFHLCRQEDGRAIAFCIYALSCANILLYQLVLTGDGGNSSAEPALSSFLFARADYSLLPI